MRLYNCPVGVVLTLALLHTVWSGSSGVGHVYVNEFVVELTDGADAAHALANRHGFELLSHIEQLGNVFVLTHKDLAHGHRSRRSTTDLVELLAADSVVKSVEQQRLLTRVKRRVIAYDDDSRRQRNMIYDKQKELPIRTYEDKSVYRYYEPSRLESRGDIPSGQEDMEFNDEYYHHQWYLRNVGQTGGPVANDLNVVPVWKKGYTGAGVVVCVLDDGIEHTHPDLVTNYDARASADLNDKSDSNNDPMPDETNAENNHGTRCAGEIAAYANNSVCGVGVAYHAKIGGVRMLDGPITDSTEARALLHANDYVDVYSASWGPRDDGRTMEGPGTHASEAFKQGCREGRGGLGSIYVWATGNGGENHDTCSCDGYVSDIHTLSVGCASDYGMSTYYSEVCPATMAVVFTGGSHAPPTSADFQNPSIKIVTTDIGNDCTLGFQGTSSAAPLAAGIIALTLEANPQLTWRDVQHLVVRTSKIPNGEETGWTVNGAGFHVNPHFGFGVMDAGRMVHAAQSWVTVPEQHECHVTGQESQVAIPSGEQLEFSLYTDGCTSAATANRTSYLEHVQLYINLDHTYRGDLEIVLTSPSGTENQMLMRRINDNSTEGIDFYLMTVHCWGENPTGEWVLRISDDDSRRHNTGTLHSWGLVLYGTADPPGNDDAGGSSVSKAVDDTSAHVAPLEEIADIMADEEVQRNSINIDENTGDESDIDDRAGKTVDSSNQKKPDSLNDLITEWMTLRDKERKKAAHGKVYNHGSTRDDVSNRGNSYRSYSQRNIPFYSDREYQRRQQTPSRSYIRKGMTEDDINALTDKEIDDLITELERYISDNA